MTDETPSLLNSLRNFVQATDYIHALPFVRSNRLASAALATEQQFESHHLRDADDHEIALFRDEPNENKYDQLNHATMDPRLDSRWTATKRIGPRRVGIVEKASPLKQKMKDEPQRCLHAARKLLDIYPLPRSQATVQQLQSQLDTLELSISTLEDSLKHPLPKSMLDTSADDDARRMEELEEAIKRDELEIFALQEIQPERQKEVDTLKLQVRKRKMRAPPPARETVASSSAFAKSSRLEQPPSPRKSPATFVRPTAPPSPITSPQTTPRAFLRKGSSKPTTPSPISAPSSPVRIVKPKVASPAKKAPVRPEGISAEDLERMAALVWSRPGMAEIIRPWARKMLLEAEEPVPSPLVSLNFKDTLRTVSCILKSPILPSESTAGSISASDYGSVRTEVEDSNPAPPTAPTAVDIKLLHLLLSTFSSPPSSSPALPIIFRENHSPLAAMSREPMLSLDACKAELGKYAISLGLDHLAGTSAIYSLVGKQLCKLDRRPPKATVGWNWA